MSDEILKIITSGDDEYTMKVEPVSEQEFTLKVVLETFTVNEQAGTVNSVNGIAPDVLGNVAIDADDVPDSATRIYMQPAERTKLAAITGTNTGDETATSIMAKIGDGSKINSAYLPSYVDDVIEVANYAALPTIGEQGKVYLTLNDNTQYRWGGTVYVAISNALDYATQPEAEGNTENTKVMTALRVFQNFVNNAANYLFASLTTTNKTLPGAINEVNANKVDKVAGLGLSQTSFTTAEKNKLAAITGTNTGDETASTILTKIGDGTKIGAIYLPSYVDDVVEVANYAALPITGEQSKVYITINDNKQYRWSGTVYVPISNPLDYATQPEAEGNTENTKVMTALRVFQNFFKNATTYVFPSLTTNDKTLVGAINEVKAGGGHVIQSNTDTLEQKPILKFIGNVGVYNEADKTVVEVVAPSDSSELPLATPLLEATNQDDYNVANKEVLDNYNARILSIEGATGSKCQQPTASVDSSDMLTLASTPDFADIHYTIDGSRPKYTSPVYSAPFQILAATRVRAIARALGYVDSQEYDGESVPSGFPTGIANRLFHYDFSDQSTITLNGSNIASIADISGNNYTLAQGTIANQPAYITGSGLKYANIITGKSLVCAAPPSYSGAFTYFIIADITSTLTTGRDKIIGLNSGTFNNIFIMGRTLGTDVYKSVALVVSNLDVDKTLSINAGTKTLHAGQNNTNFYNVTNKILDNLGAQTNPTINAMMIGGMTSASIVKLYEVIGYNRALTLAETKNIAQWLYNKYSYNPTHWTVFGDSIANGSNATTNFGFAMMTINQYKGLRYNLAVSSTGSQFLLDQINNNFDNLPLGKVLIEVGSNEPAVTTAVYLPQAIDRLLDKGYVASDIYVLSLPYRSIDGTKTIDHENVCLNLQLNKGITYVDVWRPMLAAGGDTLIADGIHPNLAGHRVMADAIISIIGS